MIGRRKFIAGLGSAAACSVVARAQQGDRIRRIGVLMPFDENDPLGKTCRRRLHSGACGLGLDRRPERAD